MNNRQFPFLYFTDVLLHLTELVFVSKTIADSGVSESGCVCLFHVSFFNEDFGM
jgi:hypothetical protein